MKRFIIGFAVTVLALVCMVLIFVGMALPVQPSAEDEARDLAIKAANFVKVNGREKGIAEIGNPKGPFVKGELYVVIQDTKGVNLASPLQPSLAGQNHYELRDADGKYFIKEMIDIAKYKGSGWVTYKWENPANQKIQIKKSYVKIVEGTDMYVLCGVFR